MLSLKTIHGSQVLRIVQVTDAKVLTVSVFIASKVHANLYQEAAARSQDIPARVVLELAHN